MTTSNIQAIKSQIEELQAKYATLNSDLQDKQVELDSMELDPEDYEDQHDEMLDDSYGDFMNYSASHILKQVDPIAYRESLLSYVDGLEVSDNIEYQDLEQEIEDLETYLADIESDIEDLEIDLEELKAEE